MIYDFAKGDLTTTSGLKYNVDFAFKAVNLFEELKGRNSKEYKLAAKILGFMLNKYRFHQKLEEVEKYYN